MGVRGFGAVGGWPRTSTSTCGGVRSDVSRWNGSRRQLGWCGQWRTLAISIPTEMATSYSLPYARTLATVHAYTHALTYGCTWGKHAQTHDMCMCIVRQVTKITADGLRKSLRKHGSFISRRQVMVYIVIAYIVMIYIVMPT